VAKAARLDCTNDMATKKSKRYREAAKLVEVGKIYSLSDAVGLLKKFPAPKFNSTITVSAHLGVDPKKSDQMVRGTCPLPHGTGGTVRVLVFAQGEAATAAKNAGAEYVGYENMIEKVMGGFVDFDVAVATPDAMSEVRKLGKFLGRRGLMPNPKTGTVTDDTAAAVKAVKAGRIDFKLDRGGNIAVAVGKASFSEDEIVANAKAVVDAIARSKPATAKGVFFRSLTISASMCPGVRFETSSFNA
jgi:large subunit ribosomal protein L1